MSVEELADVFVGTLVLGAIYALVGIGIVILFKATGMLNFAQGVFMVAGKVISRRSRFAPGML